MGRLLRLLGLAFLVAALATPAGAQEVRVKDLGRFLGWRDNVLVGYGVVTGLSGTGDSPRNEVTRQTLKNVLGRMGVNVTPDQVQSRNVAAVMVTAVLPPTSNLGDHIDVTVTSIGDSRSIVGGTLLMTPLLGPDQRSYALAQGQLVVGGYRFDANLTSRQKNYPTSGLIPGGASVETAVRADPVVRDGEITFVLKDPDVTTAQRTAAAINAALGVRAARVRGADSIGIALAVAHGDTYRLIALVEGLSVTPDSVARIVINEKSGTVVAGSAVRISSVVISQGDIRVSVSLDNQASQPAFDGGSGRSLVVTNTKIDVATSRDAVIRFPDTTVGDLVEGLSRLHVDTRGVISVLQALKAAGALRADLIVQ